MDSIVEKARELLEDKPLCDRCLGRMFARLGMGLSNEERGRALKTLILMDIHRRLREGDRNALEELARLAPRLGEPAWILLEELRGASPRRVEECWICSGRLNEIIEEASVKAARLASSYDAESFLIGCRISRETAEREEELKLKHSLIYAESIRSEIKREVGKRVSEITGLEPCFEEPDLTLIVDFEAGDVEPIVSPLLIKGLYWKTGRRVSQSLWITRRGERRYNFSVEEAFHPLLKLYQASRIVLHAAGREDADARMLGTGRPLIVELKEPQRRRVSLKEAEEEVNKSNPVVKVRLIGKARRRDVRLYKSEKLRLRKTYRALILVDRPLSSRDASILEERLSRAEIVQRTPLRVLHRRADTTRRRIVYGVAVRRLSAHLLEALIEAEGGLYVKELVSGDEGRTKPSFSEILGSQARCIELDVVSVKS